MLIADLIKSCSNAKVAEAAIQSIGPDLVLEVRLRAQRRGLEAGAYVVQSVQDFARSARAHEWRSLAARLDRVDMPILSGLHYILERRIAQELGFSAAVQELVAFRLPSHQQLARGCGQYA
jgi:hypothetical protein